MSAGSGFGRRSLLRHSLFAGGVIAAGLTWDGAARAEDAPVVETRAGKIRGTVIDGVSSFKGIPYGVLDGESGRFQPAVKPKPWAGIRDALAFGPRCVAPWPGGQTPAEANPPTTESEAPLFLNVWSAGLRGARARPVMVWLHGGAFFYGDGNSREYDGRNLAAKGDVVVVTLNHRLNAFGFLYLGGIGGERYAESGNVGLLDVVAALEWVRDNIAAFGGDPKNVTVFGESGGGWKLSTLMAMPPAKGLFHKAIVQSGPHLRALTREEATKSANAVLTAAGLSPSQFDQLAKIPADQLLKAYNDANRQFANPDIRFIGPVIAGKSLLRHPFDPDAPELSRNIPLMIGTTRDEASVLGLIRPPGRGDPRMLTEMDLRAGLSRYAIPDADADRVIATYRKGRPDASPYDLAVAIGTDLLMRSHSITEAERKLAQGSPVYMFIFAWERQPGAKTGHGSDLVFPFDNPQLIANAGADTIGLADKMARAWAAFAHRADPNVDGLPHWPAYDLAQRPTMILGNESCSIVNDPGKDERLVMAGMPFWQFG